MTREDKIKAGNMVISGAGYADTLVEDLTSVGLTIVDTRDEYQISRVADVVYNCRGLPWEHTAAVIMEVLREENDRRKKIGKVPGKKPKKEKQ